MTNVVVIHYSSTGNVHTMAKAAAQAAGKAGADEVRLLKVAELAPAAAIESDPDWARHTTATAEVREATVADVEWADVILFGTPTRFGLPAAQLKQFIDTTGGLWARGGLVNKVVSSFTSTSTCHGGQESTLLALNNTFYHWGSIIVPPGFADPVQFDAANGNPYGASSISGNSPANVAEANLAAVEFQARRAVEIAAALLRGLATA
ncbi:NAD(P)H:quinone oxidoreductase [Streptomyces albiaxialis]|uniref:NAD(P)H:quinone oxidoreductase n=1 Tax=Streptomyces albiaxialis TaxID=329523 RepID=A0ABN2VUX6_9ACTN